MSITSELDDSVGIGAATGAVQAAAARTIVRSALRYFVAVLLTSNPWNTATLR